MTWHPVAHISAALLSVESVALLLASTLTTLAERPRITTVRVKKKTHQVRDVSRLHISHVNASALL